MNIAFVLPCMKRGGAERVASLLCNYFSKNNDKVSLLLTEGVEIGYDLDNSVKIYDISSKKKGKIALFYAWRKNVENVLKDLCPDVVISFIARTNICAILACKKLGIPIVVSERNNPYLVPYKRTERVIRNVVYKKADGLVFQTNGAKHYFSKKIQKKSVVILNPVTDDAKKCKCDISNKQNVVLSACRLDPQKNVSLLIKAFLLVTNEFPEYSLHIYGDGSERENLEKYVRSNCYGNRIVFYGNVKNVIEKMAKAKIFVLPSNYEGLSNSLIEALCCGTACISTDSEPYGARELINNGINGILVPVNDEEKLADALRQLMRSNDYIVNLSEKAYITVNKKVASDTILEEWKQFITGLTNGKSNLLK